MIEHLEAAWTALTASGAQFGTVEQEVNGVPMRLYEKAPPNMAFVWQVAGPSFADRTYIVYEDESYTYAEIDAQVRALARTLRDEHGVGPGDRVAVSMRNYPEWIVTYWATILTGAALVGMNAWWTPREMLYGLTDSTPKVLIVDQERLDRFTQITDELSHAGLSMATIIVRPDNEIPPAITAWDDVIKVVPDDYPKVDIAPDDDATIFYTSGTTGFPKGAQLTHRGSVHNLLNMVFMPLVVTTASTAAGNDAASNNLVGSSAPPPIALAPTPLFHVTACNCVAHPITAAGGTIVLMYKWDAERALELIEREKISAFSGVPTMSRELINHPDWGRRDTSSLKGMGGGGAAIQPDLVEKIALSVPQGTPSVGYGLTETHGIVTANQRAFYIDRPNSVGRVVPVADVKLIDELGNEIAPGSGRGELCVRGPIVIKGYLNKPDATAAAIEDGWFRTGDVAEIDADGFIYIVDRVKDMVIRGGENVYCSEVETAIYEHDAVAEAAVFGVADERLGEAVVAAVVVRPDTTLDEAELKTFLGERIAKHKVPERIVFRTEELPRNASGKFLKRVLRDELESNTTNN